MDTNEESQSKSELKLTGYIKSDEESSKKAQKKKRRSKTEDKNNIQNDRVSYESEDDEIKKIINNGAAYVEDSEAREIVCAKDKEIKSRSLETPTQAIEGLKNAVRDSPGLWKSDLDPVDFPGLEASASNFFEMNRLSEQIAATADSVTSEGDIDELLGAASEAEAKMKQERAAEEACDAS